MKMYGPVQLPDIILLCLGVAPPQVAKYQPTYICHIVAQTILLLTAGEEKTVVEIVQRATSFCIKNTTTSEEMDVLFFQL